MTHPTHTSSADYRFSNGQCDCGMDEAGTHGDVAYEYQSVTGHVIGYVCRECRAGFRIGYRDDIAWRWSQDDDLDLEAGDVLPDYLDRLGSDTPETDD